MNPALHSSAGVMLGALQEVFEQFADTLEYPISNVDLRTTTKSFIFQMNWKCAPHTDWQTVPDIKKAMQQFSLELFKTHGYLVKINDPEVIT